MIRQQFDIEDYWTVIIYYDLDYGLFEIVDKELSSLGASEDNIATMYDMLSSRAKAMTYSNLDKHISLVVFNPHKTKEDYVNSIIHEAEHVKQAMLQVYKVEDRGEAPAYTIGYLVSRMYKVFKDLICDYNCF